MKNGQSSKTLKRGKESGENDCSCIFSFFRDSNLYSFLYCILLGMLYNSLFLTIATLPLYYLSLPVCVFTSHVLTVFYSSLKKEHKILLFPFTQGFF